MFFRKFKVHTRCADFLGANLRLFLFFENFTLFGLFARVITPSFLKPGSRVRIISTARKISPEELQPAITFLEKSGFSVDLGKHVYAEYNQFAGTDAQRLEDLQQALDDPQLDMIWCSRGGYGTVKLIDHIDFGGFLKNPKWVVGYSDITGLLCHLTEYLGVASIHATMPINVRSNPDSDTEAGMQSLVSLISGETTQYSMFEHSLSRYGDFSGELIGGNLSIIYSILGSVSAPKTDGKILFLEDLDEYLYHVDRMMVNLKRNGILSNLSGLIVGGMTDMNDNTVPFGKTAEEIVLEHVQEFDYPVYFGFPAGHLRKNLALPFGVASSVKNNRLSFDF